ncbi:MAG: sugar transferase [Lachnospiraceae bacterium]|nr:sugar transferase [Lachnospiraceae bacterium]
MYQEKKSGWIKHLDFTILDLLMQELAFLCAFLIRFRGDWFERDMIYRDGIYQRMAVILFLIDICVVFFTESYSGILRRNRFQELTHTIGHCFIVFGGLLIYMYATRQSLFYSRGMIFLYLMISICFEYIVRVLWKRLIRRRKILDVNKSDMLLIVEEINAEQCVREVGKNLYTDFKVTGIVVVDKDMTGQEILGIPVVCNADGLLEYLRTNVVDEVFIDGNTRASSDALAAELVEFGITVHVALVHTDQMLPSRRLESYGNYTVLTSSMNIRNARQLFLKRLMDIVGALVGLLFTGIAFLIFAPIIKHQSPGPVFYGQPRVGRNGRRFKIWKFRSMYPDADRRKAELMAQNEMQGLMFKMENDPRIFPIGHFMRKHSIDELPQFWNVLIGDMSLVGTRPPTEDEFKQYELHHKARLAFRPGLTGMWQVSGRSDITDFEEIVKMDTQYIANWTLGLDIKIILKTIAVVFTGRGSK